MKNFYAVVRGHHQGVFASEEDAKKEVKDYYDGKYKGFYSEEEANIYLRYYNENEEPMLYVVKCGRKPGIYEDREEAGKQVVGFKGALVRKYKVRNRKLAEDFFLAELRFSVKPETNNLSNTKIGKKMKAEMNVAKEKAKSIVPISFKNDYVCFMDSEANNSRVVSIGALLVHIPTMKIVDRFYETCKPIGFEKMDPFCEKLTHLTTDVINNSDEFLNVFKRFESFLNKYDCKEIATWSSNDRKFFSRSFVNMEKLSNKLQFIDIQKRISLFVFKNNKSVGLKDMKQYYQIGDEVKHHALLDAVDMWNVFKLYNKEVRANA